MTSMIKAVEGLQQDFDNQRDALQEKITHHGKVRNSAHENTERFKKFAAIGALGVMGVAASMVLKNMLPDQSLTTIALPVFISAIGLPACTGLMALIQSQRATKLESEIQNANIGSQNVALKDTVQIKEYAKTLDAISAIRKSAVDTNNIAIQSNKIN